MRCPVCDDTLREIERYDVKIDICPGCKGVWLDRGELDKIVEMASNDGQSRSEDRERRAELGRDRDRDPRDHEDRGSKDHHHGSDNRPQQKKRRGSWLGDIFEGFGD